MSGDILFEVKRIGKIISQKDLPGEDGDNINGPCCIEVPEWCENKLGKYYLYFSHHKGQYIRMAYSDFVEHSWKIHHGGVIDLSWFKDAHHHIASPDILIDNKKKEILLYFHAPSREKQQQWTYAAISKDGVNFIKETDKPLAPFYMRVFQWREHIYGMTKGGNLWRSKSGIEPFEPGPNPFDIRLSDEIWHNDDGSIRHVALSRTNDTIYIFYTCIGDSPERIYCSIMNISDPNWFNWKAQNKSEVMRPIEYYEGANLVLKKSSAGAAYKPENALRDPDLITIGNTNYLFYSVQGEQGIAVSRLSFL
jgi:hypothetical protein